MDTKGESQLNISFAEFELDSARRQLRRNGEPLSLYAKTYDLLTYLLEHNGRVVTKDEILDAVWEGQFVEEANLSVQISALRKALGEKKEAPRFLVTVPGKGYKFVADIQNGGNEIVIEKHKFSRVVVEEDIDEERENGRTGEGENKVALKRISPSPHLPISLSQKIAVAGIISILALGIGGFWVLSKNRGGLFSGSPVEKQPKIKKLTNNGKVANAVLSPDGRFFAYAEHDKPNWQTSIRLGQVDGGGDVVLRPVADVVYRVTTFSADGGWLYYTAAEPRALDKAIFYKMPVLGGVPQKLADGVSTYSILSPDEKQIAFVRNDKKEKTSTLVLAGLDGTNRSELTVRPYEKSFSPGSLSWSADGKLIALSAANTYNENDDANQGYEIFTIGAADGRVTQLTASEWSGINRVEWLKDGSGLAITARKKDPGANASPRRSLWLVDFPDGKARKISVDLNTYAGSLSLTADTGAILVVQGQFESNIWVAPAEDPTAARQITFGSAGRMDGWYGMDWTPDGQIVYVAWIGESSSIWKMDADGGDSTQLTPVGFRDERPSVTADGAFIVFQSNRSGKSEIWRMGTDGSDPRQLTKGEGFSSHPSVTPDGNWIFYMNERGGESSVWRISVEGGDAVQITDKGSSYPRVSPDGRYIACGYTANGKTSLAIFPIDGGEPVKLLDVPNTYNFTDAIRWTQDGKFIAYRDWANGIWRQSVDGGEPQRLDGLPKEKLLTYGWSRDGKQLAFTRSKETLDAVLITNEISP